MVRCRIQDSTFLELVVGTEVVGIGEGVKGAVAGTMGGDR
jgi:uncharacterized membrane protein